MAILSLFELFNRTHAPATELGRLAQEISLSGEVRSHLTDALPGFLALGSDEHFMTDDGQESSYALPWDLFTRESGMLPLDAATKCMRHAEAIVARVRRERNDEAGRPGEVFDLKPTRNVNHGGHEEHEGGTKRKMGFCASRSPLRPTGRERVR